MVVRRIVACSDATSRNVVMDMRPQQVKQWVMRQVGLSEKLAHAFVQHDIDHVALMELNLRDLEEMRIESMSMRHRILFEIKALKESVFGKGDADRNMSEYNLHHSLRHTDLLHETATELLRTITETAGAMKSSHRAWMRESGLGAVELYPCETDASEGERRARREAVTRSLAAVLDVNLSQLPVSLGLNELEPSSNSLSLDDVYAEEDDGPLVCLTASVSEVAEILAARRDTMDEEVLDALSSPLTSGTVQCNVCFEDVDVKDMVSLRRCTHQFCRSCLKKFFDLKIQEGDQLQCPGTMCGEVHPQDVQDIVSESNYMLYLQRQDLGFAGP